MSWLGYWIYVEMTFVVLVLSLVMYWVVRRARSVPRESPPEQLADRLLFITHKWIRLLVVGIGTPGGILRFCFYHLSLGEKSCL
jgi:hypothetical protein